MPDVDALRKKVADGTMTDQDVLDALSELTSEQVGNKDQAVLGRLLATDIMQSVFKWQMDEAERGSEPAAVIDAVARIGTSILGCAMALSPPGAEKKLAAILVGMTKGYLDMAADTTATGRVERRANLKRRAGL